MDFEDKYFHVKSLLAHLTAMDGGNAKKCREHFWPWAPGISTSMSNPLLAHLTTMDGGNAKKCREHFWPWAPGISTSMYKKATPKSGLIYHYYSVRKLA